MTINDRTRLLSLVFSTVTAGAMVTACSGIDGLPDEPNDRVDAGQDAAPSVDATLSDAGVAEADAQVSDAQTTQDATVDAGLAADSALDDATADASVDAGPCIAEDNGAFCTRQGKNCGTFSGFDNCGTLKTVASCGTCSSYYESCGGGGQASVCGCLPESDWAFCTRTGHSCGSASGTDNCGNARTATSCGGACPADAGAGDATVGDGGLPDSGIADASPVDSGAPDASVVTRWTFSNCAATGATGPTQAQCDTAYGGTSLAGAVTVNAGIQSWTVPATGTYRIVAMGAQGGDVNAGTLGGRGALIQGEFDLVAADGVVVLVGQQGQSGTCASSQYQSIERGSTSGGGASFVTLLAGSPLVVAGGGGGGGDSQADCVCSIDGVGFTSQPQRSCGYQNYTDRTCQGDRSGGRGTCGTSFGAETTPPMPPALPPQAGGGGGLAGTCGTNQPYSGRSLAEGGAGGSVIACRAGGFGGGGAGGGISVCNSSQVSNCQPTEVMNGAGGGGGYSGGSAGSAAARWGSNDEGRKTAGSGGSSFSSGVNPINLTGYRTGDGLVTIERIR